MGSHTAILILRLDTEDPVIENEFISLVKAANYIPLYLLKQQRYEDTRYQIGFGKLQELATLVDELTPDCIIFWNILKPKQYFNIFQFLRKDVRIMDRIDLILEIFSRHAGTRESRLQIELAQLNHELIFIKEKTHFLKQGEQPGFHGPGRYPYSVYKRDLMRQASRIKKELTKIKNRRALYRQARKKKNYYLVTLVGYTNAGKSTLLNALCNANVPTSEKMFTTLGTYTRELPLLKHLSYDLIENKKTKTLPKILVTDTVGFIYDLPDFLLNAFLSTLEEVRFSDMLLLVLDLTDSLDVITRKLRTTLNVLAHLDAEEIPKIAVLNKMDLVSPQKVEEIKTILSTYFKVVIPVSALNKQNLTLLVKHIFEILFQRFTIKIFK